jgi:glycosyltransferase involved in cell wall biosynthesis
LVTIGRPWNQDEAALLAQLGLQGHVRRLDPLPDDDLVALYRGALALVQPSVEEGFGLPLVEAMATGCPVVARPLPATIELADGVPHYVESDDPESAGGAFDAVANGVDDERRALGRRLAAQLDWTTTAAKTVEIYRSLEPSQSL